MPLRRHSFYVLDKTIVYEYNEGTGNLEYIKIFGYTTGALSETPLKTETLTYADTTHSDILTKYGTKSITYNSIGCPISYDGKSFTWSKGKLQSFSIGSRLSFDSPYQSYSYTYNARGQRVIKSYSYSPGAQTLVDYVTDKNSVYTYDNAGRLIYEKRSENYKLEYSITREFTYLYDESGMIGFMYSYEGATPQAYYYQRNLQGDVVAIYNTSGVKQAGYAYDAYGNCTVTDSTNSDIATANAIRYRGYYFDTETNWYFLNARYYSPEWRRFISPDDTAYLDPESPNGLNLYCYCGNDPVNNIDPSGHEWYNPLTWDWGEIVKGVGLIITGVGAIAVGIVTLPYGGWISAVAGITILAGGGTTLFGLSDVGEGITDYNVIQEAVFMGNENAYNLTENIFMYTAIAGTAICGLYGATHTTFSSARSTPRTGNPHSGYYNRKFNTLTYYGKNGEMKYSMHLFDKGHQWIHWHTELPHSKPINNFLAFVWKMLSGGV